MKTLFFIGALALVVLSATETCCGICTVAVSGTGKTSAAPNIASFSVTYSSTQPRTQAATADVNRKVSQALQVLARNFIPQRDISTGQYSINPEYDYVNGSQKLKGQRASQTILVKIRDLSNSSRLEKVLDDLSAINGSQISQLSFDISNKKPLEAQARRLAYNDALAKARQYSQLTGQALQQVFSINEGSTNFRPVPVYGFAAAAKMAGDGSSVPLGQNDVEVNVDIIWKIAC
jgi:uncharacterized protein YggE